MSVSDVPLALRMDAPIIHAIEDAVLLGHTREIGVVLDLVEDDEKFPQDLRNGLEALLYFRLHYGKGGVLEPQGVAAKQETLRLESVWGRELIEKIGHCPDMTESKYAS